MSTRLPRPPLWLVAAGLVGWAVFTFIGSQVDQESTSGQIWHDVLQTGASVSFALFIGGGFLGVWQQWEWQRRTQWIPFNLMNQAMRQIAILVSSSVELVTAPPDGHGPVAPLSGVFILPWSAVGDRAVQVQVQAVESTLPRLIGLKMEASDEEAGPYQSRVIERLQAVSSDLEEHADRLWDLASKLGVYIDDVLGPQLLTSVAELHDAVRDLVDPLPGDRVTDPTAAALTGFATSEVVKKGGAVAQRLGQAYVSLDRRVTNDSLRERLREEERRRTEADKSTSDLLDTDEEAEQLAREVERVGKEFAEAGQALLTAIQEILDSPDTDKSTLREVAKALEQTHRTTTNLEQTMKDDTSE